MKDAFGNDIQVDDVVIYVAYDGGRSRKLGVARVKKVNENTCAVEYLHPAKRFEWEKDLITLRKSDTIYVLNGRLPVDVGIPSLSPLGASVTAS